MGPQERAQKLLIDALLAHGWRVDEDLIVAPHETIWLSHAQPWERDIEEMIEQVRGRLERCLRHAAELGASDAWRDTIADTQSLFDALEAVVPEIEAG